MTVVALASIKGSPGVTTAAMAIAASWPEGRKVLLVEADPFGGDLAARFGVGSGGGVVSLVAAARRQLSSATVWEHSYELPGGLPVLFGMTTSHQAMVNEEVWLEVALTLAQLDADVIVDVGRLLPRFAAGVRQLLDQTDALVVLCDPTLEAIIHLRDILEQLKAQMHGRRVLVVPASRHGYSSNEIRDSLSVAVGPTMPDDPKAASALANRSNLKHLDKARLLKWATEIVVGLGLETALADQTSLPDQGDLSRSPGATGSSSVSAGVLPPLSARQSGELVSAPMSQLPAAASAVVALHSSGDGWGGGPRT